MDSKYKELGIDVKKQGIQNFKSIINNLSPNAFCVINKHGDSPTQISTLHTDGAGSKPVQSYLNWKETGDINSFKSLAQDVIAMNSNDVNCVGIMPSSLVDYIAINPDLPKQDILKSLSFGFKNTLNLLKKLNINIDFLGGETADLPDQIRTLDISATVYGIESIENIITGQEITEGNIILGLSSSGLSTYETKINSGIMCNGITLARHCLMDKSYSKLYPELTNSGKKYYGSYKVDSFIDELDMTVGDAIISPTRIYSPLIKKILSVLGSNIKGLIHNTGGGQTKCLNLTKNILYVKDDLLPIPHIFKLIQKEAKEDWRNMFQNYNMGVGFEIIIEKDNVDTVLSLAESFKIDAKIIGKCLKNKNGNKVIIKSKYGKFLYT